MYVTVMCIFLCLLLLFVCVCVIMYVLLFHVYSCVLVFPFFFLFVLFFIPVSLSDGHSSSQALRDEKEAAPLDPPQSRKGRFQVDAQVFLFLSY